MFGVRGGGGGVVVDGEGIGHIAGFSFFDVHGDDVRVRG